MKSLLNMRIKQGYRTIRQLGTNGIVLVPIMLYSLIWAVKTILDQGPWAMLPAVGLFISIVSLHIQRKDLYFLSKLISKPAVLTASEYVVISLPFVALYAFTTLWWIGPCMLLGAAITALLPTLPERNLRATRRKTRLISPTAFELIGGWRKYKGWIMLVILLMLVGHVWSPAVILVGLLILTMIFLQFYLQFESKELVELTGDSPTKLILRKTKTQLGFYFALTALPSILFLIQDPELWFLLLYGHFMCSVAQFFTISFKYAFYRPGEVMSSQLFSTYISIVIACFLLPWFSPLPLIITVRYFLKGRENLKSYCLCSN
jgi:hypothetical protein